MAALKGGPEKKTKPPDYTSLLETKLWTFLGRDS